MKKISVLLITIALVFIFITPCFAETLIAPGSTNCDVFAKYNNDIKDLHTAVVIDGKASLTTEDGIVISTQSNLPDGTILHVVPVLSSHMNALNWFKDCLKNVANKFVAFDIFFKTADGTKISSDEKIKITITVPKDFTSPAVYYVANDGKIEKLASITKNDDILFITDHNSFYAVVDEKSDIPQTGDNSTIILYELIILLSFSGILTLIIMRKKV